MEKDFNKWSIRKQKLDKRKTIPFANERDIFWCSVGINIGDEENGKDALFLRPVLVFKKFSNNLFWGIPMSSKNKENPYYIKVFFKDKISSVMISHLRLYDTKRLVVRIGKLYIDQFDKIIKSVTFFMPKPSNEDSGIGD